MKISVLCSDPDHPVLPRLRQWRSEMQALGHDVSLLHDKGDLTGGDLLFLVSCTQIIGHAERRDYGAALVLHASDLPKGRGWSPHVWSILQGADRITVCLLEAKEPVDSGPVWFRTSFTLQGHELLPEINARLFSAELELMTRAVHEFGTVEPLAQSGDPGPYLNKRTTEHSRLDVQKTIAEQFDLLRVVDNLRYPAFFDHRGKRYRLTIKKADDEA
jgi:methionyl-tRNA formyltransferase